MSEDQGRRVAILVHTASDWSRAVLRGMLMYNREHSRWRLWLEQRGVHERLVLPNAWRPDGILVRLTHDALRQNIEDSRVPAVNVSWWGTHQPEIPQVVVDDVACAQLAMAHLREKGFRNFGYIGPNPALGYGDAMLRHCRQLAGAAAFSGVSPLGDRRQRYDQLSQWLRSLETPVGVVAWDAETANDLLEACELLCWRVPEDVGVVCIEHDELMDGHVGPSVSSVDQNPLRVGYEAARRLHALLRGELASAEATRIQPLGVVGRQSTELTATDDVLVTAALRYIQANFAQPIQVPHVCDVLRVSRRQLEDRFRHTIQSSPAREIRLARLERVKQLLLRTTLGLDRVASLSGFDRAEVMMRAFKREFGETAGEFRRLRS